tara:strand:+ start:6175 stop:7023 length:849 start_codon:yes stop_codon:yes gene_type:complete
MAMNWSGLPQCYEFDTGEIMGGIQPYMNYHGVCGLMHRDYKVEPIRHYKAFLNAEYYLRPGSGMVMYPRQMSLAGKISHDNTDDTVNLRFPSEPDFGLEMDLSYRAQGDAVDCDMVIRPSKEIPKFEIFFASYIVEAFDETWVPLKNEDGSESWELLDNRVEVNRTFGIARDVDAIEMRGDGRYGDPARGLHRDVEDRFYSKPILVARNSTNGFSLIFLLDPISTTYLTGQFHKWDTAHDWCFGDDLVPGKDLVARTRMVYRCLLEPGILGEQVNSLWDAFC